MTKTSGLTVRQHARESIDLRAEFAVREEHREQVRFSTMSGSAEPHVTRGVATDISSGGAGLVCPQFVPRMCEGTVRVYGTKPIGKSSDGSPVFDIVFEHAVKVRRVTLESHEPTFALGLAFIDASPDIEERVQELIDMALAAKAEGGAVG